MSRVRSLETQRPPAVTIAVCTHNRVKSLSRTLRCLLALDPAERAEILVVDNQSTDATRRAVFSFMQRDGRVRYVHEAELGVSFARNRAIAEARGAVIAFVDDDETVTAQWLRAVLAAFEDPANDLIFGRLIVYNDSGERLTNKNLLFHERDYGDKPISVTSGNAGHYFFGTGISAYRLSALRQVGEFRTDVGHKGERFYGGEDSDMYRRFVEAGKRVTYWPPCVVHHHIDSARMTWRYALRKAFDGGVSFDASDGRKPLLGSSGIGLLANSLTNLLRLCRHLGLTPLSLLWGKQAAFRRLQLVVSAAGRVWGCVSRLLRNTLLGPESGKCR